MVWLTIWLQKIRWYFNSASNKNGFFFELRMHPEKRSNILDRMLRFKYSRRALTNWVQKSLFADASVYNKKAQKSLSADASFRGDRSVQTGTLYNSVFETIFYKITHWLEQFRRRIGSLFKTREIEGEHHKIAWFSYC